jgi:hypothetical protein
LSTREPLQVGPITLGFVERPGFRGFCATWNGVAVEVLCEDGYWGWHLDYERPDENQRRFEQFGFTTAELAAEDLRLFLVAVKELVGSVLVWIRSAQHLRHQPFEAVGAPVSRRIRQSR